MKVGFIVDGTSELEALPKLMPMLSHIPEFRPLRPVRAAVGANAPVDTISFVVAELLGALANRDPELVIVLWDREQRPECPGALAQSLWLRITHLTKGDFDLRVVIKDRMFENWLVAALPALPGSQSRFLLSQSSRRSISPNKADNVDALGLMKMSVIHGQYEKVKDSQRILAGANIDEMATNSRSFRRFLRCLGHPDYLDQSKLPRRPRRG